MDLTKLSLDQLHDKKIFNRLMMTLGATTLTVRQFHDLNDALLVEINRRLTSAPENLR